jgi:vacuolar protein sorting-associated protein 13A/C
MDSTLTRSDTMSWQNDAFEAVTSDIPPSMVINLDFEGLGLSLVNRRLVEVVYVTLSKLQVEYTDSPVAQSIRVVCRWVQVDNQLQEAIYPIVLQPSIAAREDYDVIPAVQMSALILKDQSVSFG